MILSIPTTFVLFCTEPQIINADLGFQHFKLIIKIYKQDWISIRFSIQHADHTFCTLHISCQLTLSEVNSTQILLIFESMQHCRNDQEQDKLLTHFCCWWWCFHASIFLALMLVPPPPRDAWCFVVPQGDQIKYIVVITVYFEVYCMFKSYFAQKKFVKSNAKSI